MEQPSEAESQQQQLPFYKRKWFRAFAIRLVLRTIAVIVILVLTKKMHLGTYIDKFVGYIQSLGDWQAPMVMFGFALIFSTISPTGYLPTVLSGATLPLYFAVLVSYTSTNVASQLNLLMVRKCLKPLAEKCVRRRVGELKLLNRMVKRSPVWTVMMFRFPFIGYGVLNYLFSLSLVKPKHYILGNMIGLLPGSVLFSLLGQSGRSLLQMISMGVTDPKTITILVVEVCLVLLALLGLIRVLRRAKKQAELESQQEQQELENNRSGEIDIEMGNQQQEQQEEQQQEEQEQLASNKNEDDDRIKLMDAVHL